MLLSTDTKYHREGGRKWALPIVLHFAKRQNSFGFGGSHNKYDVLGFRSPKAGEYFLSGAKIAAYYTNNDLGAEYLVVKPTTEMQSKSISVWEEINNND